jgi:hypothetical protein
LAPSRRCCAAIAASPSSPSSIPPPGADPCQGAVPPVLRQGGISTFIAIPPAGRISCACACCQGAVLVQVRRSSARAGSPVPAPAARAPSSSSAGPPPGRHLPPWGPPVLSAARGGSRQGGSSPACAVRRCSPCLLRQAAPASAAPSSVFHLRPALSLASAAPGCRPQPSSPAVLRPAAVCLLHASADPDLRHRLLRPASSPSAPVAAIVGRLSNSAFATRTFVNSSNPGCCQLRFLWFAWFPVSCSSCFSLNSI